MNKNDLVKCAQLDMLIELKRICEEYNLKYFLAGGTLLGAIRHNGFIPWDDDIDLAMPREDYEKFIDICDTELDKNYQLIDWHIDEKSPLPFLKMKIKGTHYREEISKKTEMNDEIFIDIFPIDAIPDKDIFRKKIWLETYLIKKILLLRCGFSIDENKIFVKKILYFLLKNISRYRSINRWKYKFEKIVIKYNNLKTKNLVCYSGAYSLKKEMKPRKMLSTYCLHKFETEYFSIPKQYDEYLTSHYGDYMKLPPKKEQISKHRISYVDLGNYKIKSTLKSNN